MSSERWLIVGVPAVVAVLVQLLFVLAMQGGWSTLSPTVTAKPAVIQASLVSLKPKPAPAPKPKPKPRAKPKVATPKPVAPKPEPVIVEKPPEPAPPAEPVMTEADRAAAALAALQEQLLSSLAELPDSELETDDELLPVQQVAASIQLRISQNWRRPPSARNGMEVLLQINLVPTGEVVGIAIMSSSGSSPFDSSAVAAIERIRQFPEVATLSIKDFEKYFRQYKIRLRPEDLRY